MRPDQALLLGNVLGTMGAGQWSYVGQVTLMGVVLPNHHISRNLDNHGSPVSPSRLQRAELVRHSAVSSARMFTQLPIHHFKFAICCFLKSTA